MNSLAETVFKRLDEYEHSADVDYFVNQALEGLGGPWFWPSDFERLSGTPERCARLRADRHSLWCCYYAVCLIWADSAADDLPEIDYDALQDYAAAYADKNLGEAMSYELFLGYACECRRRDEMLFLRLPINEIVRRAQL